MNLQLEDNVTVEYNYPGVNGQTYLYKDDGIITEIRPYSPGDLKGVLVSITNKDRGTSTFWIPLETSPNYLNYPTRIFKR